MLSNQHSYSNISALHLFLSVNAKPLEQPVFQAGPNRCESDHGHHLIAECGMRNNLQKSIVVFIPHFALRISHS